MYTPEVYLVIFTFVGVPIAGLLLGINIAKRQGLKKIWILGIIGGALSHVLWILSCIPMTFVAAAIFLTADDFLTSPDSTTWLGFLAFIIGSIVISLMLTNIAIKRIAIFIVHKSTSKD
jgi:hypothetical protein